MTRLSLAWHVIAAATEDIGGAGRAKPDNCVERGSGCTVLGSPPCWAAGPDVRGVGTTFAGVRGVRGCCCNRRQLPGGTLEALAAAMTSRLPDAADPGLDEPAEPVPAECKLAEQALLWEGAVLR
mmetsp:Transcript_34525/g.78844  ORF Transcript_34525/g.78844 Transcript_34525/m.78844 type:complete len:125 (-) Transcript_34525:810-1184(-)